MHSNGIWHGNGIMSCNSNMHSNYNMCSNVITLRGRRQWNRESSLEPGIQKLDSWFFILFRLQSGCPPPWYLILGFWIPGNSKNKNPVCEFPRELKNQESSLEPGIQKLDSWFLNSREFKNQESSLEPGPRLILHLKPAGATIKNTKTVKISSVHY